MRFVKVAIVDWWRNEVCVCVCDGGGGRRMRWG